MVTYSQIAEIGMWTFWVNYSAYLPNIHITSLNILFKDFVRKQNSAVPP